VFVSFKIVPVGYITRFFRSPKHFSNSIFGIAFKLSQRRAFNVIYACKTTGPFKILFIFGNRKKSRGAVSGEYGDRGVVIVLFLAKSSRDQVWTGYRGAIIFGRELVYRVWGGVICSAPTMVNEEDTSGHTRRPDAPNHEYHNV